MLEADEHPIIVFDGMCNLCNRWVEFVLARDTCAQLRFAAVQSVAGGELLRRYGQSPATPQTLLLVDGGRCYQRSAAMLRILARLGWHYRLMARAVAVIPAPLRDWLYAVIARNRYRLFGRPEVCSAPPRAYADRFLH
jgi:predicted DCC family thiol-disulfide oxidoreductase YuxK